MITFLQSNLDTTALLFFNGNASPLFDSIAMTLTSAMTWLPLYATLLYIVVKNNETAAQKLLVVLAVIISLSLTAGIDELIVKPHFQRLRPINDPQVAPLLHIVPGLWSKTYSFFSAHAANTFGIAVLFTLLIRNARMALILAIWSLTNCWTRLYLGMHYPSDILVGLLWGLISGAIAYIIYLLLYRKLTNKSHFVSTQYTSSGYFLPDITIVINVVLLTFLYAIFKALIVL